MKNQRPFKKEIFRPHKDALIIAGILGFFGVLWIMLSDRILFMFVNDVEKYKQAQTYKGWVYVFITVIIIYLLIKQKSEMLRRSADEIEKAYEELLVMEENLLDEQSINENIFEQSHVVIGTWDQEGRITRLNPFGQNLFGYTQEEVLNKKWLDLFISEGDKDKMVNDFNRIQMGQQLRNHESCFLSKDGIKHNLIWNNTLVTYQNKPAEVISIGTDITDRKILEERLKRIAYYDVLTQLPNRAFIEEEMRRQIIKGIPFCLIHLDLDNFKQVNDVLDHSAGDEYLIYIADKLRKGIQPHFFVARLNGDEFAVLYTGIDTRDEVERLLGLLIEGLGRSWEFKHHEFFTSTSIGIVFYPKDGEEPSILFRNADIAMYKAKKNGKNGWMFYTKEILEENAKSIRLANHLQNALKNKELTLYYQPQHNLENGTITGLEALVRWIHPEDGFVPPNVFIPIAEETGQIYEIELWIFETALKQKEALEQSGKKEIDISINLSSKTLTYERNFNKLDRLFCTYDIDYTHITIEITETAILSDIGFAFERIEKLRKRGIKIALDDFGTGYSSLMHLKHLPIDIVKLDRDFIKNIEEDDKDAKIIKSILYLTKDLNYEVVAEGIETKEQLIFLQKYKCKKGQGYLMSRPTPIEEIRMV